VEGNIVHTVMREANWIGHISRGNCLTKKVIKGNIGGIEVT
jgi:hypothetical protein